MNPASRSQSLLDILPEDERRRLLSESRTRRFAPNEVVFHHGDPGDCLHLVMEGHIGIRVFTPLGDIATVRLVRPGEFFGELAVVAPGPRNATAVAFDRSATVMVSRQQLEDLRVDHRKIDAIIISALVTEIRRLSTQVVDLMYLPTEKRLWRVLHELTETYGTKDGPATSVPLTQHVLAQLTGCTRPTANRILRSGESDGTIALQRSAIEILDLAALKKYGR